MNMDYMSVKLFKKLNFLKNFFKGTTGQEAQRKSPNT